MKFLSFLNDLVGEQPRDPSLVQGQELLDFKHTYTRQITPTFGLLETTTMPGVGSVIEAMDTAKPKVSAKNAKQDDITELETEFNRTLTEYDATYKLFSENVLNMRKSDKEIQQYFGQAITSSDGNYKYVNDYGYTHKYSTDAWAKNADSCPTDAITVSDPLLKQFHNGPDMGIGQACGVAAKNVRNKTTNEIAWVDIQGYKHIYSPELWNTKALTCNVPVIDLAAAQYDAIPKGGNMKPTDTCPQLDIDPAIWSKLMHLNDKLLNLSEQLAVKLEELIVEDVELQLAIQKTQSELQQTTSQIKNDRPHIHKYRSGIITADAEMEDTYLNQRSIYMHMIVWFFVLITVFALTFHAFTNNNGRFTDTIGLVFGIIALYIIVSWLYHKYRY